MSSKRKSLRNLKQKIKSTDSLSLNRKVLSSVLAVGFALTNWAMPQGVEAAAAGQNGIVDMAGNQAKFENNVANIYAQNVSAAGNVGLNRFQYFDVTQNQQANLYFNQKDSNITVNTLINMVQNQINIAGTVNAIRNNKIGGNLYFLSPKGMIVSGTGVINAGSLTVMTPTEDFFKKAAYGTKVVTTKTKKGSKAEETNTTSEFVTMDLWDKDADIQKYLGLQGEHLTKGQTAGFENNEVVSVDIPVNAAGTISVAGKINAATAIKLIAGRKAEIKGDAANANPVLKTGVAFNSIVNLGAARQTVTASNDPLTFTDLGEGKMAIVDPSNAETAPTYYVKEATDSQTTINKTVVDSQIKTEKTGESPTTVNETTTTTTTTVTTFKTAEFVDKAAFDEATPEQKGDTGAKVGSAVTEAGLLTAIGEIPAAAAEKTEGGVTTKVTKDTKTSTDNKTKTITTTKTEKKTVESKEQLTTTTFVETKNVEGGTETLTKKSQKVDDGKLIKSLEVPESYTKGQPVETKEGNVTKKVTTDTKTTTSSIDNTKDHEITTKFASRAAEAINGDGSITVATVANEVNAKDADSGFIKFMSWFGNELDINDKDANWKNILKNTIAEVLGTDLTGLGPIDDAISKALKSDGKISVKTLWENITTRPDDTAIAETIIAQGASLQSVGAINVTSNAAIEQAATEEKVNLGNMMASTKAITTVKGNLNSAGAMNITADATSTYTADAIAGVGSLLMDNGKVGALSKILPQALTDSKAGKLAGSLKGALNNLHVALGIVNSEATVNIDEQSTINAGGPLSVATTSTSADTIKAAVKVTKAKQQESAATEDPDAAAPQYTWVNGSLGFIQSSSKATVNVKSRLESADAVSVNATSTNTIEDSLALEKAEAHEAGQPPKDAPAYLNAVVGVVNVTNEATVNVGTKDIHGDAANPFIKGTAVTVDATTNTGITSNMGVAYDDSEAVSTAVNVVTSNTKATVNNYAVIGTTESNEGGNISITANNNITNTDINTNNSYGEEDTLFDQLKSRAVSIFSKKETPAEQAAGNGVGNIAESQQDSAQEAAGDQVQSEAPDPAGRANSQDKKNSWNQYFTIGASVMVANMDNKATVNLEPNASVNAVAGAVNIGANFNSTDPKYRTINLLVKKKTEVGQKDAAKFAASAAVSVQNTDNKAEVNVKSEGNSKPILAGVADVKVTATTNDKYQRLPLMVDKVVEDWYTVEAVFRGIGEEVPTAFKQSFEVLKKSINTIGTLFSTGDFGKTKEDVAKVKEESAKVKEQLEVLKTYGLLAVAAGVQLYTDAMVFTDPVNYATNYAYASAKDPNANIPGMLSGTVNIENLHNTANVNIDKNITINSAMGAVDLTANTNQGNVLLAGKLALDQANEGASVGIGGSVGVQNSYTNSNVTVKSGTVISGHRVNVDAKNSVMNANVVIGGAQSSTLGLTGMVGFMGGESNAKALVDNDVNIAINPIIAGWNGTEPSNEEYLRLFGIPDEVTGDDEEAKAAKKLRNGYILTLGGMDEAAIARAAGVLLSDLDDPENKVAPKIDTYLTTGCAAKVTELLKGKILDMAKADFEARGSANVTANNNTVLTNVAGNVTASQALAVGASVGVVSYDVHSLAQVVDLDKSSAAGTGSIQANKLNVAAVNDGVLNNITIAGVSAKDKAEQAPSSPNTNDENNGTNINVRDHNNGSGGGTVNLNDIAVDGDGAHDNAAPVQNLRDNPPPPADTAEDSGPAPDSETQQQEKKNSSVKLAAAGSVSWNDIDNKTIAELGDVTVTGINLKYLTSAEDQVGTEVAAPFVPGVKVNAEDKTFVGAYSGAMALTKVGMNNADMNKFSATLSGAVAANDLVKNTTAKINKIAIDDVVNIDNKATNSGIQLAAGVALGIEQGKRSSTAGFNAALSASINLVDSDVVANVENAAVHKDSKGRDVVLNNSAYDKDLQVAGGVSVDYAKSAVGIGATVAINKVDNDIKANIIGGEIGTDGVGLSHVSNMAVSNLTDISGAVSVGVVKSNFALNGAVDVNKVTNKVEANVTGAKIKTKYINVEAKDGKLTEGTIKSYYRERLGDMVSTALDLDGNDAMSLTKDKDGNLSGDINVTQTENTTTKETTSSFQNTSINNSANGNLLVGAAIMVSVNTGNSAGANAGAGVVYSTIDNDFTAKIADAEIITTEASTATNDAVRVEAASANKMIGAAAGVAVSTSSNGIAAAGSAVVQKIDNDTIAVIENSKIVADKTKVDADTKSTLTTVAGEVSVSTGLAAAGMTWAQNHLDNTTGAYVKGLDLDGLNNNAAALNVNAKNEAKTWAIAAGVGVAAAKGAATGAYAANEGFNDTEAIIGAYTGKSTKKTANGKTVLGKTSNKTGSISAKAEDISTLRGLAGTVNVTVGYASIGGAVINNYIGNGDKKQSVKAEISDVVVNDANNTAAAELKADAINNSKLFTLAAGGAVAANPLGFSVSAQGSVALSKIYGDTNATVKNITLNSTKAAAANSVMLQADANSTQTIENIAGGFSVAASTNVSIAAFGAVSKVNSNADVKATIDNIKNGAKEAQVSGLEAKAKSTADVLNIAAGLTVSGAGAFGGAATGNVAINNMNNNIAAKIANTNAVAYNSIAAIASSKDKLRDYGGAVTVGAGGGAGVALGATVVINNINGNTTSLVENSNVTALGNGAEYTVKDYESEYETDGKAKGTTNKKNKSAKGVVVASEAEHEFKEISVTLGVGAGGAIGVGVNATVAVNTIEGKTEAKAMSSDINKGYGATAAGNNMNVTIAATDDTFVSEHVGTISAGGSGLGSVNAAAAVDTNTYNRTVEAGFDGGTAQRALNGHNVDVKAFNATELLLTESGLSAGGSAGLSGNATGSVTVDHFTSTTKASVKQAKSNVNALHIDAENAKSVHIYTNAGAVSVGAVGIAVASGVAVIEDESTTEAYLGQADVTNSGNGAAADNKVAVEANNNTRLMNEVGSGGIAVSLIGAGAGVSVGVNNFNNKVKVNVENSNIGRANNAFNSFSALGKNAISTSFTNVAVGGGYIGVGIGVGVNKINTGVAVSVNGSQGNTPNIYAKDIAVKAAENRYVGQTAVGAMAGAGTIGTNVLITNVGTAIANEYKLDDGTNFDLGKYDNIVTDAKKAQNKTLNALTKNKAKTDKDGNLIEDSTPNKFITQDDFSKAHFANAQEGISGEPKLVNKAGVQTAVSNASLQAANKVDIGAKEKTIMDIDVAQAAVALVGLNVSVGKASVKDELEIEVKNATIKGKEVAITSMLDDNLKLKTMQAAGTLVGAINVGYSSLEHGGSNKITVDNSNIQATIDANEAATKLQANADYASLNIQANNELSMENMLVGAGLGMIAGGAAIATSKDDAKVEVDIKNNKALQGQIIGISAENNPHIFTQSVAAAVSLISGGASIGTATAAGESKLIVENNKFIADKLVLDAVSGDEETENGTDKKPTTKAKVLSIMASKGAIGVNKARTYNQMKTNNTVKANDMQGINAGKATDVNISAQNVTSSIADIRGVTVGLIAASGSNFAQTNANSKVELNFDAGAGATSVNNLKVLASNSDNIAADTNGDGGGIVGISPKAAVVQNTVETTTTTNVTGKLEAAGDVYIGALRTNDLNLYADSLNATLVGGSGTEVTNKVTDTTTTNVQNADIKTAKGKSIALEAQNKVKINKVKGVMMKGNGYGGGTVTVAEIDSSIMDTAKVKVDSTKLDAGGGVSLAAHSYDDLTIHGYVNSAGVLAGSRTTVENRVTNNNTVELGSGNGKVDIKNNNYEKSVTMAAYDDIDLNAYANAENKVALVGITVSELNNTLNRNNYIDIKGNNNIYSSGNVNYLAGMNASGNLSLLDMSLDSTTFNGTVIPTVANPILKNSVNQNNQVKIGQGTTSSSVCDTNFYADSGRELAYTISGSYTNYTNDRKSSYVSSNKGDVIPNKSENNFVDVNGKVIAGVANKILITIGDADNKSKQIILVDKEHLSEAQTMLRNYYGNGVQLVFVDNAVKIDADPSLGLTVAALKYGTEDYANSLIKRYDELSILVNEYKGNATIKAGYEAEKNRIAELMISMRLAQYENNKLVPINSHLINYIELPDLTASGGNINITTDDLFSSQGTGELIAKGSPEIDIVNNSYLTLKTNDITLLNPGGKIIYNDISVTGDSLEKRKAVVAEINKTRKTAANVGLRKIDVDESSSTGNINIYGNYQGIVNKAGTLDKNIYFRPNGSTKNEYMVPVSDIMIQGNINNYSGSVNVKSLEDNITIAGKTAKDAVSISARSVALVATKGSVSQGFVDGIVNIGGDPEKVYALNMNKQSYTGNLIVNDIPHGSLAAQNTADNTGSRIVGNSVYINAADINVNGYIQSGFAEYYVRIDDAAQNKINAIKNAHNGNALSDAAVLSNDKYKIVEGGAVFNKEKGCYEYRFNTYYNPASDEILLENVDARGGRVFLTGRISSTGGGNIICLDGVSNITVTNPTSYDLKLGSMTTNDVKGVIQIADTNSKTITRYTRGQTEVFLNTNSVTVQDGVKPDSTKTYGENIITNYEPQKGLRYNWSRGQNITKVTKYRHQEKSTLWGAWWPDVTADGVLDQYTTTENILEPTKTSSDPLKPGTYIGVNTTATAGYDVKYSSVQVSRDKKVDEDKKWSEGYLGVNKYVEATWTISEGYYDTYQASVKADNPINISFIGHEAAEGNVSVHSGGSVTITGNIGNRQVYDDNNGGKQEKGSINIVANGSIEQVGGSLYGQDISMISRGSIKNIHIVAGDTVNFNAANDRILESTGSTSSLNEANASGAEFKGDTVSATIDAAQGAKGNVVVGEIGSVNGATALVSLTAYGNISQAKSVHYEFNEVPEHYAYMQRYEIPNGQCIVGGERIDIVSINGGVYGTDVTGLKVKAGQIPVNSDSLSASLNVHAKGNINVLQETGNLRIGKIYSDEGDVTITVGNGSLVDALPYVPKSQESVNKQIDRWLKAGIIEDNSNTAVLAEKRMAETTYAIYKAMVDSIGSSFDANKLNEYHQKYGNYESAAQYCGYRNIKEDSAEYTRIAKEFTSYDSLKKTWTDKGLTMDQVDDFVNYKASFAGFVKADGKLDADAFMINKVKTDYRNSIVRDFDTMKDLMAKPAQNRSDAEKSALQGYEARYNGYTSADDYLNKNAEAQTFMNNISKSTGLGTYTAWDKEGLLYAISNAIINPVAGQKTADKDANIYGHNITINVKDNAGLLSDKPETIEMTTLLEKDKDGNLIHLADLQKLAAVDPTNVTLNRDRSKATILEVLPIGIQQSVVGGKLGSLVINSQATDKANSSGDIFLEGRSKDVKAVDPGNLNFNIKQIYTKIGDVQLNSLGNILGDPSESGTIITANTLTLYAYNDGRIGDSQQKPLLVNIDGRLKASGAQGVYIRQADGKELKLNSITSGHGDIYLEADEDITMDEEYVEGKANSYISVSDEGEITIISKNGSLGEAAGTSRETNNGLRIKNSTTPEAKAVNLTAAKDIYVTGITSSSAGIGGQGFLNLNINSVADNPLQNVGINVDGTVKLVSPVEATNSVSIHTANDMLLEQDIKTKDLYLASKGNVNVSAGKIEADVIAVKAAKDIVYGNASGSMKATDSLYMNAGRDININAGDTVALKRTTMDAGHDINITGGNVNSGNSTSLKADNDINLNGGNINGGTNTSLTAGKDINLTEGRVVANTLGLTTTKGSINSSYDNSQAAANGGIIKAAVLNANSGKAIDLGSRLNELATVKLNAATNIILGNGGSENLVITLANSKDTENVIRGAVDLHNYVGGAANDMTVISGLAVKVEGDLTITNDEGAINNGLQLSSLKDIRLTAKTSITNTGALNGQDIELNAGTDITNSGALNGQDIELNAGTDITNSGNIEGKNIKLTAKTSITNSGDLKGQDIELNAGTFITNSGALNGQDIELNAGTDITNSGDLKGQDIELNAGTFITNSGNIEGKNIKLIAANDLTNSGDITVGVFDRNNGLIDINSVIAYADGDIILEAGGDINNENGDILISGNGNISFNAGGAINNFDDKAVKEGGYIIVKGNGNIDLKAKKDIVNTNGDIIVSGDGNINIDAGGSIHNYDEGDRDAKIIVEGNGNIDLKAKNAIYNFGEIHIYKNGNITVKTEAGAVLNGGDYVINGKGDIDVAAAQDIVNEGYMIAFDGGVKFATTNGSIYNLLGADIYAGGGSIEMLANGNAETNLDFMDKILEAEAHNVKLNKKGSVYNGGDMLVKGGSIILKSAEGGVYNYDNFEIFDDGNSYDGVKAEDISTGSIVLEAKKGVVYNRHDLYADDNVEITAKLGLNNYAYNVFAGNNITLHATAVTEEEKADIKDIYAAYIKDAGDIQNKAQIVSLNGDITLKSDSGNILNANDSTKNNADIIALGGSVTLEAEKTVTNDGDLIALGKGIDTEENGTISLISHNGDVINRQNLNKYNTAKASDVEMHSSTDNYNIIVSDYFLNKVEPESSLRDGKNQFAIAAGNVTMSARNGKLINGYIEHGELVGIDIAALGNVDLTAKVGLQNFGYDIYAGKNVTLTATEGDLINSSRILSIDGDVSLVAEKGGIENILVDDGYLIALAGSVKLDGKDTVINTGEIVALGKDAANGEYGTISLKSNTGNVYNSDEFDKLKDWTAKDEPKFTSEFAFNGEDIFNPNTKYNKHNQKYMLATGNIELLAPEGYLVNTFAIKTPADLSLQSKYVMLLGDKPLVAKQDIVSTAYNKSELAIAEVGRDLNIEVTGESLHSTASGPMEIGRNINLFANEDIEFNNDIESLNGSLAATSTYGLLTFNNVTAENGMVAVGTQGQLKAADAANAAKAVVLGTVQGKQVVLYNEANNGLVYTDKVVVDDYLLLQANNVIASDINKVDDKKQLAIDATGANGNVMTNKFVLTQDVVDNYPAIKELANKLAENYGVKAGEAATIPLVLSVKGDARFNNLLVTSADITTTGKLAVDRMKIAGTGHFDGMGFTTGVYGGTLARDNSYAIYFDYGKGYGKATTADLSELFGRGKKNDLVASLKETLDAKAAAPETFGTYNDNWMNLYIDKSNYQRSNGLLLHMGKYHYGAYQRYALDTLSEIIANEKPVLVFDLNWVDHMHMFNRYDLYELPDYTAVTSSNASFDEEEAAEDVKKVD